MCLTPNEYEAFIRGQAAGLIPCNLPLPENMGEIDNLIFHIGILFCRKIAIRHHDLKLKVITLTTFSEAYMDRVIRELPQRKSKEIRLVTLCQKEIKLNLLEGLYHYFAFGLNIVDPQDIAERLAIKKRTPNHRPNPNRLCHCHIKINDKILS